MRERLVVLFRGHSQYDSVNTMVDELAQGLRAEDAETLVLDTRTADCVATAVTLVRDDRVRLFLSLNGFGIPEPSQGAGFYRESTAPLFIYFVDHPAYHHARIRTPVPRLVITFPTAHHVGFCRSFIRDDIVLHHLPHATKGATPAPWGERDIALFLSASLLCDPETFRTEWSTHGADVAARLNAIVEAHDARPLRPLHEVIVEVLGFAPPIEVLASYFVTVDTYLRSRVKRAMVAALAHLPLLVCGNGWERAAERDGLARFIPSQPIGKTIELMRRSQIVLNPLPAYYESHERPLQAMANGAVAANGPSEFMEKAFTGGFLSHPHDGAAAAAVIEAALANKASLERLAAVGHVAVMSGHLWQHRARTILSLAGQ